MEIGKMNEVCILFVVIDENVGEIIVNKEKELFVYL